VTTDRLIEQRIRTLYAVSVPAELDRRIDAAITAVPVRHSRRRRLSVLAALAAAAILATTAVGPTYEWLGWYGPFDRLWQIATPVNQSVTVDGYEVTLHRAYADRLGVRLAMTFEDLEDRLSWLQVEDAVATDARGRAYEAWNWAYGHDPADANRQAIWARFLLPKDGPADNVQLLVNVTSLRGRITGPIPTDVDPDRIAERILPSVSGSWQFQVDVPITPAGQTISPTASASVSGVTIDLEELALLQSGILVRLTVKGLPEMPAGSGAFWTPTTTIQLDGVTLDEAERRVEADGAVTVELMQVPKDLAGHWKITVNGFWSSGPPIRRFGTVGPPGASNMSQGPWVMEFDVPRTP
jgi:hypothetical protein